MAAADALGAAAAALLAPLLPRYKFVRVLGTGAYAIVSEAIDTHSGHNVAIKAVKRGNRDKEIQLEIAVLERVRHPNCIRLLKVEQTLTHTYLVMEICSGGELLGRVMQDGPLSEYSAKSIARRLFHSVAHLHDTGIMHRDLKLENVLLASTSDLDVKIVDFGLASIGTRAHDVVGSLQYMAPEIVRSLSTGYTPAVDCWSLGIILHGLILGFLPFCFEDTNHLENFANGEPPLVELFGYEECSDMSSTAKDLIRKLLAIDPQQRLSAKDALAHPWITGGRKCTRPTKRKVTYEESGGKPDRERSPTPTKRRHKSLDRVPSFANLLTESPKCITDLLLGVGPRCESPPALELPANALFV